MSKLRYTEHKFEIDKEDTNVLLWVFRMVIINTFAAPYRTFNEMSKKFLFFPRRTKLLFLQTCIGISISLLGIRVVLAILGIDSYFPIWIFGVTFVSFLILYFVGARKFSVIDYIEETAGTIEEDEEEEFEEDEEEDQKHVVKQSTPDEITFDDTILDFKIEDSDDLADFKIDSNPTFDFESMVSVTSIPLLDDSPDFSNFSNSIYSQEVDSILNNENATEQDILNCNTMQIANRLSLDRDLEMALNF